MVDYIRVLLTATLSFVVLFIISKLMGKKQIAQLDFVDYVVGISIGSIAAQMSVDGDIPYYHFITAMAIYLVLDIMITFFSRKSTFFRKIFKGKPIILIYDGKLIYKNIKKSKLSINDFLSLCRKKDYFNINDISYCVFETNGELSILPNSYATPIVSGDMDIKKSPPNLSIDFIIDGKIIDNALKQVGKTKSWLQDKLKSKSVEKVNNIALAIYNNQNDDVKLFFKNETY